MRRGELADQVGDADVVDGVLEPVGARTRVVDDELDVVDERLAVAPLAFEDAVVAPNLEALDLDEHFHLSLLRLDRTVTTPEDPGDSRQGLHMLAHVVHARHPGAALGREHRDREGCRQRAALRVRVAEDAPEEALAGGSDDDRASELDEPADPGDELEVVVFRLAEADARVQPHPLLRHARGDDLSQPPLEERAYLVDDVLVARRDLHRRRISLHVDEADVGTGLGDDADHVGVPAQGRHVVDEAGAELERPPRDPGLRRIDRDRSREAALPERLEHRDDASELLVHGDRMRARPRRLAPDVDDRSTLGGQALGMGDGRGRVLECPPVREGVGSHVHDAHHRRAGATHGQRTRHGPILRRRAPAMAQEGLPSGGGGWESAPGNGNGDGLGASGRRCFSPSSTGTDTTGSTNTDPGSSPANNRSN